MRTEQEILDGNKLIAEFIDLTPHDLFPNELQAPGKFSWMAVMVNISSDYAKESNEFNCFEEFFKFHSSWDWLIPVIEKIEIDCKFDVHIYGHYNWEEPNRCVILDWRDKEIVSTSNDSKIQCVFDAVVNFIKWYNQNK